MKRTICFLIFFSTIVNAQIHNSIDSLKIFNKYNILLYSSDKTLPLLALKNISDPDLFTFESSFLNNSPLNQIKLNSFTLQRIKSNMVNSFKVFKKGENKYYLGVVSDILGYASTAATVGLAAYHLVKYKKNYGIK